MASKMIKFGPKEVRMRQRTAKPRRAAANGERPTAGYGGAACALWIPCKRCNFVKLSAVRTVSFSPGRSCDGWQLRRGFHQRRISRAVTRRRPSTGCNVLVLADLQRIFNRLGACKIVAAPCSLSVPALLGNGLRSLLVLIELDAFTHFNLHSPTHAVIAVRFGSRNVELFLSHLPLCLCVQLHLGCFAVLVHPVSCPQPVLRRLCKF